MKELAYFSAYAGSSNMPAITLADRLYEIAGMQAVFFTCGGAEANESAFKTARFYWKASGKPEKVKVIARGEGYHGVTLQAMSATKMGSYWKMFEPRVPGFRSYPDVLSVPIRGSEARRDRSVRRRLANLRKPFSAREPERSRLSSVSRSTALAA